jgi:hypothetical protein
MRELRQWTLSWLSPELCGGVAEKSIHDVHAHLFSDLQTCRGRAAHFAGCKADVRKCFDSVQVSTAIRIWKHLGAPPRVLSVLNDFFFKISLVGFPSEIVLLQLLSQLAEVFCKAVLQAPHCLMAL